MDGEELGGQLAPARVKDEEIAVQRLLNCLRFQGQANKRAHILLSVRQSEDSEGVTTCARCSGFRAKGALASSFGPASEVYGSDYRQLNQG